MKTFAEHRTETRRENYPHQERRSQAPNQSRACAGSPSPKEQGKHQAESSTNNQSVRNRCPECQTLHCASAQANQDGKRYARSSKAAYLRRNINCSN
jgi:hypothetical protein